MARDRRARAPEYYGAWVGGEYYEPGALLPRGTTDYLVVAVENLERYEGDWKTVQEMFEVGTDIDEIEAVIGELFEAMIELNQSPRRRR